MSDIHCAKCSEPYESYGIRNGDMSAQDAKRFLSGEGCPCCAFGTACTDCLGTGKDRESHDKSCTFCRGYGTGLVRQLVNGNGEYQYSYVPNVKVMPEKDFNRARNLGMEIHDSLDGKFREYLLACPYCKGEICLTCNGSGQFQDRNKDRTENNSAVFEVARDLFGDDIDGQDSFLEDHTS